MLDKQGLIYILNSAIEGGINYWADILAYDSVHGIAKIKVWDESDQNAPEFTLTPESIQEGLNNLQNIGPKNWAYLIEGDYDAYDSDLCIQAALFNEIVFG